MTSQHRKFSDRPESSQATTPTHQPYYGTSWAIVIGINDYAHAPLVNARHDAEAIAELLRDVYRFEEVHTLYDAAATERAIMSWLWDDLRKRTKADDRVIFFFAGHGTTLKVNHRVIGGYLIPHGAQPDSYADYIDMQELNRACGAIPAKHILLILDCCFSGVAAVTARAAPPPSPSVIDDTFLRNITQRRAWQVLTAGASDELVADSGLRPGNSAFTAALLDGLKGKADHNSDGLLTASELANYVRPRVVRETASVGRGQSPFFNYLAGSEEGDFVFLVPDVDKFPPPVEEPAEPDPEKDKTPFDIFSRLPLWAKAIVGVVLIVFMGSLMNYGGGILAGEFSSFLQDGNGGNGTPTTGSAEMGTASSADAGANIPITNTPTPTSTLSTATRTATPTPSEPEAGATRIIEDITFVYVPAGEFTIGDARSNDEKPHTLHLDGFWIMRTEVTNAQYRTCVERGPCTEPANDRWGDPEYADHPVTDVDWQQSNQYAQWVEGRLPTEAEWEKACRGTEAQIYPWGDQHPTDEQRNVDFNLEGTVPVGSYPGGVSPYGVLDMAGSVREWTSSLYEEYPYDPADGREDPEALGYRVVRGGSWNFFDLDVRCARRDGSRVVVPLADLGFRVVRHDTAGTN